MKDREKLKEDSKQEYQRDKQLVDTIIDKIKKEDMDLIEELGRKKEVAKTYMYQAYEEKELRKKQHKQVFFKTYLLLILGRKRRKRKTKEIFRRSRQKRWRVQSQKNGNRRRKESYL